MSPSLVSQFRGSHWYGVGKSKLVLGPFTGGINSEAAPELMAPNALVDCVNYVIRPGGVLYQRPSAEVNMQAAFDPTVVNTYILGRNFSAAMVATVNKATWVATFYQDTTTGPFATAFGSPIGLTINGKVLDILLYNDIYYFLTSKDGVWQATSPGSTPTKITASVTALSGAGSHSMEMVKDRLIVVGDSEVFWTKATDPTVWAAPDGGFVNTRSADGTLTVASVVYQDAIYLFKSSSIWRFSWSTDPSVDGILEQVTHEMGGYSVVLKDNELIFCNENGVYAYQGGFIRELSGPIRTLYQQGASTGSNPYINILGELLIVGPLNGNEIPRGGAPVSNPLYGNHYFIYDTKLGIWYRWQFSSGYGSNSVPGPIEKVTTGQGGVSASERAVHYWVGLTDEGRSLVRMDFIQDMLNAYQANTFHIYDVSRLGNNRLMGQRFTTSVVTDGDGERFKRLFGGTIDATHSQSVAGSYIRLTLTTDVFSTNLDIPPQEDRIKWGGSFRFRTLQLYHDAITGINPNAGVGGLTGLQSVRRITLDIQPSRETTVGS